MAGVAPPGWRVKMAVYKAFAEIYDALMDDIDYDAWAEYYLALIRRAGVTPQRVCDCACGTGSMSVRFAAQGMSVTGVDISAEMLERAQAKARLNGVQTMFVCQDICAFQLPRPVDAVVCACDGVNYLLDDGRLNAFFSHARDALRQGGALAFDISSRYKLEHVLGDGFFGEERDDVAYLWSNRRDLRAGTVTMDLTFFVRRTDGLYRRFSEVHVQKAHDPEHLARLLSENGFGRIEVFGDRNFDSPSPEALQLHICAVRE